MYCHPLTATFYTVFFNLSINISNWRVCCVVLNRRFLDVLLLEAQNYSEDFCFIFRIMKQILKVKEFQSINFQKIKTCKKCEYKLLNTQAIPTFIVLMFVLSILQMISNMSGIFIFTIKKILI